MKHSALLLLLVGLLSRVAAAPDPKAYKADPDVGTTDPKIMLNVPVSGLVEFGLIQTGPTRMALS